MFILKEKKHITRSCFAHSDSDPRLPETAQHEKQTGEQDRGRRTEEDPHGHHHGPAGSAGGEDKQDSGFHREQTERIKLQPQIVVKASWIKIFIEPPRPAVKIVPLYKVLMLFPLFTFFWFV